MASLQSLSLLVKTSDAGERSDWCFPEKGAFVLRASV